MTGHVRPRDPGLATKERTTEFPIPFTLTSSEGTPHPVIDDTFAREALGMWRARDPAEMSAILKSLPLEAWMTDQTARLMLHPGCPGLAAS